MERVRLGIKRLAENSRLPEIQRTGDAGFDLYSTEEMLIETGKKVIVPLGIASEIPLGWRVIFKDRSGLAAKQGLHVLAGVIDSNYRGEWKVVMVNLGEEDYLVKEGDRIAQGLLEQSPEVEIFELDELSDSNRGAAGFGSSGTD